MAAEDFFARWARKKTEAQPVSTEVSAHETSAPQASAPPAPTGGEQRLPTLEDVAQLTPEADFSAFMSKGVDEGVKRAAMKKLFSDPHFNVMDGLDVYIDDYNTFEALTPDVIATLNHAKTLLDPLSQCSAPTMNLLDAMNDEVAAAPDETDKPRIEERDRTAQNQADTPAATSTEADASATQQDTSDGNKDAETDESNASHSQP
jgi:hypothetical protein